VAVVGDLVRALRRLSWAAGALLPLYWFEALQIASRQLREGDVRLGQWLLEGGLWKLGDCGGSDVERCRRA
jgi:hypothetical protein